MDADPAKRNIFGVDRAPTRSWRTTASGVRQFGQQIIEWLGGKRIHPAWVVPGGVSEPLTAEVRDAILAGIPEAIATIERTLDWYKSDMLRWEDEADTFGNFRSRSWAWWTARATWTTTTAGCASSTPTARPRRPASTPTRTRLHRRGGRAVVVPEVAVLQADGLPGRHLPRRARWRA